LDIRHILPGLLIAWLTARWIPVDRPDPSVQGKGALSCESWEVVLRFSNIRLLMILMLCWLMCLITTSAFLPSYLVDYLKLNDLQMGIVMSAIGLGAATGSLLLSWASDKVGRKPVVLIAAVGALLSLGGLSVIGANPLLLFLLLFLVQFFNFAGLTLTVGPICAESVPAGLMATASGMVIACGELLGGGFGPILAGHFTEIFGIVNVLYPPMAGMALAALISLGLKETQLLKRGAA
jgi:predicted MFS family arabinose efflux permease